MTTEELYAVYSNDDGVVLCTSKDEANTLVEQWIERGAGGVDGPFGPFDISGGGSVDKEAQ